MSHTTPKSDSDRDLHRHLSNNESRCIRQNTTVRVDTINTDRDIAFCSVEQRNTGFLRRTHSHAELVWSAEQALAPLIGMGILPMINVREKKRLLHGVSLPVAIVLAIVDSMDVLAGWLGISWLRESVSPIPVEADPFGW